MFTLKRTAARVVLLNHAMEIFLIRASDPADASKGRWWEIPGGGMDPHESSEDAARRELFEETGIHEVSIGPCIWTQHAEFTFAGLNFDQDEFVHVAWCKESFDYAPAGLESLEALAFEGHRWWPLDDLMASDERVLPARLREFLPDIVSGTLPDPPLDISHNGEW